MFKSARLLCDDYDESCSFAYDDFGFSRCRMLTFPLHREIERNNMRRQLRRLSVGYLLAS